jgi:hypothetical protein
MYGFKSDRKIRWDEWSIIKQRKEIMRLCKTDDFSYVAQSIVVALHLILSQ